MKVPESLQNLCGAVFGSRLALAESYAEILADEGIQWGLLGPREVDRLWDRHIVNSLCVSPLISPQMVVADIGSGAGLPGIALAIARPDLTIDLVEPMQRRVEFLNLCVDRLGLSNSVQVVRARAEEYRGRPDVVTCRAVSSVSGLVDMMAPLLSSADLLAIKGEKAHLEVDAASGLLQDDGLVAKVLTPTVCGEVVGTVVRITRAKNR